MVAGKGWRLRGPIACHSREFAGGRRPPAGMLGPSVRRCERAIGKRTKSSSSDFSGNHPDTTI